MEQTGCSETLAHTIQTPENHPKERIQNSQYGQILKSRIVPNVNVTWSYDGMIYIWETAGNMGRTLFFFLWRCGPTRAMAASFLRFLDHTQQRITVGRTPLDEWSSRCRDLYLTTRNTHNRQTSMPPVGFEPTISAGERPQPYALNRAATGTEWPVLGKHSGVRVQGLSKTMKNLIREGGRLYRTEMWYDMVSYHTSIMWYIC